MIHENSIKNYILYLKKECRLSVTLHIEHNSLKKLPESLVPFNIHDNPYCIRVKDKAHNHCIECQKKVKSRAETGAYIGVCHAGVKEFVYPVKDGEKFVGFISVSGYRTENSQSYIEKVSRKYKLPLGKLYSAYAFLKEDMPEKEWVDTLIIPLISMLDISFLKSDKDLNSDIFAERVKKYILEHRNENISSQDICRYFSCSRSYLSREFNSFTGKSIPQYLTELRIADAKMLLKSSNLSITEIAFTVGFGDSNYFSNLFKAKTGLTPREYRNKK